MNTSGILEEMTIEDVSAFNPQVGVIAVGSTEPHGPHLPYATDTLICTGIVEPAVREANRNGARALMLPTLPISLNNNMKHFPFALRYNVETFMRMLWDLCEQLEQQGVMKIVIVNAHGGNPDVIRAHQRNWLRKDGAFCCTLNVWAAFDKEHGEVIGEPSTHAGECETSQIMHLKPEWVVNERLEDNPTGPLKATCLNAFTIDFVKPWNLFLPTSAHGETRTSTPEKGKILNEAGSQRLAKFLIDLAETPWTKTFPY